MHFLSRFLAVVVALVALSGWASAADIPTKAPAKNALFAGYPYFGSGFYFGVNTMGGGGSVSTSGAGSTASSGNSNQAAIGGTFGYVYGNGTMFYAVEAMFDWQSFNNGSTAAPSLAGPATFEQRLKIGTPLTNFLSLFPSSMGLPTVPPFPQLPNGAVATNVHPYLMAGLHEDQLSVSIGGMGNQAWRISPSLGVGAMGQLTNGVAVDVWLETVFPQSGVCAGPSSTGCASVGQQYKAGMAILY